MDVKKIGAFLAQLRKEQNLTQEELGEKLGVTNKTISRWENGNYLPPVEMLQELSGFYGLSINEILSGERLTEMAYRERAEENIKAALGKSAFTLKEKIDFYKKKWLREHLFSTIVVFFFLLCLHMAGFICKNSLLLVLAPILELAYLLVRRNQMMIYVEDRAFDGTGAQ